MPGQLPMQAVRLRVSAMASATPRTQQRAARRRGPALPCSNTWARAPPLSGQPQSGPQARPDVGRTRTAPPEHTTDRVFGRRIRDGDGPLQCNPVVSTVAEVTPWGRTAPSHDPCHHPGVDDREIARNMLDMQEGTGSVPILDAADAKELLRRARRIAIVG